MLWSNNFKCDIHIWVVLLVMFAHPYMTAWRPVKLVLYILQSS